MMKLKNWFSRIPRPVKACLCSTGVLLLAALFYISVGCPTLTLHQEFRRAERVNLVGPSKVVDSLWGEYQDFDRMLVGETENGVCFLGKYSNGGTNEPFWEKTNYVFSYREKAEDITVLAAPNVWGFSWDISGVTLPVYVFADHPEAARAEVTLTVSGTNTLTVNGEKIITNFSKTFTADAAMVDPGVFRCFLTSDSEKSAYALALLSNVSAGSDWGAASDDVIPVTVQLYDKNGEQILEKEMKIYPNDTYGGATDEN